MPVRPPDYLFSTTTRDFLSLVLTLYERDDDEDDELDDSDIFFFFFDPLFEESEMMVPDLDDFLEPDACDLSSLDSPDSELPSSESDPHSSS